MSKNIQKLAQSNKVYYPEVIKPTVNLDKMVERSNRETARREQKERHHKEMLKQMRVGNEKSDRYTHAIDLLIKRAEEVLSGMSKIDYGIATSSGVAGFSIYYYEFNFENTRDSALLFQDFLNKLINEGCIKFWDTNPLNDHTQYVFSGVHVDNLKMYKNRMRRANNVDPFKYFDFDDNNFWLERLGKPKLIIQFSKRKSGERAMFYLMKALDHVIRSRYEKETIKSGTMLRVIYSNQEIETYVEETFQFSVSGDWFKNTKGNLVKKIPEDKVEWLEGEEKLINVGPYDRSLKAYIFSVILPF